eukprot:TRINITY_DN3297_c1_g2_i2.p1 TRINITY_DN3297_c1_g2~~TRINITY_DN3297_c1_g2_i2.p1  ORF type:complete len:394 (+),score=110.99 TRINITY_DN3297_c1_g2_i2:163-1344(+)
MSMMSTRRGGLLPLFLFSLVLLGQVEAYRDGDLIRMSKRISNTVVSHNKVEPWTDVSSSFCPRFQHNKQVELALLDRDQQLQQQMPTGDGQTLKMSFGFDSNTFVTPWITVFEGSQWSGGVYLNSIEFIFYFSGDDLVDMKWNTDYDSPDHRHGERGGSENWRARNSITVQYRFEHYDDEDAVFGLGMLLMMGALSSSVLFAYIIISTANSIQYRGAEQRRQQQQQQQQEQQQQTPASPYDDGLSNYVPYSSPGLPPGHHQQQQQQQQQPLYAGSPMALHAQHYDQPPAPYQQQQQTQLQQPQQQQQQQQQEQQQPWQQEQHAEPPLTRATDFNDIHGEDVVDLQAPHDVPVMGMVEGGGGGGGGAAETVLDSLDGESDRIYQRRTQTAAAEE